MREIKFRVMDINGNWHYYTLGDFVCLTAIPAQLRPETWTQFTGITDKNGVDIYEGDIVEYSHSNKNKGRVKSAVIFDRCGFTVEVNHSILKDDSVLVACTVIGNIYQNPELLNG